MKARYSTSLTLNEEDQGRVKRLNKAGITIIEIFRLGLAMAEKKLDKTKKS